MAVSVIRQAITASGSSEFVFPSSRTKGPLRGDAVTKALQRICRRMDPKIEGLGPHDIRRTIGTLMRKLGISTDDRSHVFNHVSGAKSRSRAGTMMPVSTIRRNVLLWRSGNVSCEGS